MFAIAIARTARATIATRAPVISDVGNQSFDARLLAAHIAESHVDRSPHITANKNG